MIKINYNFTTIGPLHTGSDEKAGTLRTLRRQKFILPEPVTHQTRLNDDVRREAVVRLCMGVWNAIDWDNVAPSRRMKIWDEFSGKLLAASRASNKYQFLELLCRSWGIKSLPDGMAFPAFEVLGNQDLLDTVRNETQYIVLKMRAMKADAKEQKENTGQFTLAFSPIETMEPVNVERVEDWIPCISGNSFRGRFRRLAMDDFCRLAGIDKMDKRTYHTLFSGGFLDQSTKYEDFDKMEQFVSMCPMLGVLGAAIGNMTIEGEAKIGWAYPLCRERGTADQSFWSYLDTVFQTRSDSSKTEKRIDLIETDKDHAQQMKYEYEVFADGTPFEHRVAFVTDDPLLVSSWWRLLSLFVDAPYIGGMGSVGNGEIKPQWDLSVGDYGAMYMDYIANHKDEIHEFWSNVKI